jgi:hypothetical protein
MSTGSRAGTTLVALVMSALVGGCGLLPGARGPYPDACASFEFSPRRCAAIVEAARESAATRLVSDPVAIELLAPTRDSADLGGYELVRVAFELADGTSVVEPVVCVGVPGGPGDAVCQEPRLAIATNVDHDVPCSGEPPEGCPSPIVPDPAAVQAARPLRLPALVVPIEGLGRHEVELGRVGLPNGYVTRLDATIVNDQPTDFWITSWIRLELRPEDAARPPFGNVYMRPLADGVEDATAWLVFEVTEASPGAVLELADIVAE